MDPLRRAVNEFGKLRSKPIEPLTVINRHWAKQQLRIAVDTSSPDFLEYHANVELILRTGANVPSRIAYERTARVGADAREEVLPGPEQSRVCVGIKLRRAYHMYLMFAHVWVKPQ